MVSGGNDVNEVTAEAAQKLDRLCGHAIAMCGAGDKLKVTLALQEGLATKGRLFRIHDPDLANANTINRYKMAIGRFEQVFAYCWNHFGGL